MKGKSVQSNAVRARYIPKEISWMAFNERVLQEAADASNPLLERIKFLGIYSNNLDEFFRIRVATLKRLALLGQKANKILGYDPAQVVREIQDIVIRQQFHFGKTYKMIQQELAKHKVFFVNEMQLSEHQQKFVKDYFNQYVRPNIMPVMIDQVNELPALKDDIVYLAVCMHNSKKNQKPIHALIDIPTNILPRFVILPEEKKTKYIIFLDDIIRFGLRYIFYLFDVDVFSAYTIKVTKDAELDINDDVSESYIHKVTRGLEKRKEGEPVRFIYDEDIPSKLLQLLLHKMDLTKDDTQIPGGRYHNFKDFLNMPDIGLRELSYPKTKFLPHKDIPALKPILASIAKTDILLSYPYHSFGYFIDLLREASIDPKVKSIKITLYRLAKHSSVIDALVNAARNGKHVVTLLELQARFDEEANIAYGTLLREEGVKVLYGVPGLKVHAKLCLIERLEGKNLISYASVATGNFNEVTARVYTDHMLLTAERKITQEVSKIFDFFTRTYQRENFNYLLLSPFNSRQKLIRLIGNEIEHARAGRKAHIHLKLNNLVDPEIIALLYQAAKVGVDVKLNIRGMCSLVPDRLPNITARCIVDKYLEHTRILFFWNNGDEKVFISSADLMTRNLDRRIEVICPIYNKEIKSQLREIFNISWRDNVKARIFDKNQSNARIRPAKGEESFRSQEESYKYLLEQSHSENDQQRLKF